MTRADERTDQLVRIAHALVDLLLTFGVDPDEPSASWRALFERAGSGLSFERAGLSFERAEQAGFTTEHAEALLLDELGLTGSDPQPNLPDGLYPPPIMVALLTEPEFLDASCRLLWARKSLPREHPLPPLLATWAVAQVATNRHQRPLLPSLSVSESRERGRFFGGLVPDGRSDDAQLPLFGADQRPGGVIDRVPLLGIADAATGGAVTARGRGAPLELALPVTAMLAVDPADRRRQVQIAISIRELRDALWPHGWERRHDWPRLQQALLSLNARFIPWGDGGRWYPLLLRGLPPDDAGLDELVILDLELPPGAEQGTPINRRRLTELRVDAGGTYRALIAATALAWQPGKTRVPAPSGRMVWSSDPARYPLLTRKDRSEIVFGAESKTKHTRAEVDGPFERLEKAGDIIIADRDALDPGRHETGWRIVPAEAATARLRARVAGQQPKSEGRAQQP